MHFHLVSIISNQEVVIFHLTLELDKDQDCTDIEVRVFLNSSIEMLGDMSKTVACQLKVV
jgi:hypothetical protein